MNEQSLLNGSYCVSPVSGPLHCTVEVPGSKSITNRALLLAALADGESILSNALFSEDSRHFLACLVSLGFPVVIDEHNRTVHITGFGGRIPKKEASLYVGSAGTAARFLTVMLSFSEGTYHMDASEQMRRRPMKPLLSALESIGVSIHYHEKEGFFPFTVTGSAHTRNEIEVDIESSSQFLSALLMSAPMKKEGLTVRLTGKPHALSYVKMTTAMMEQFGCSVLSDEGIQYTVPANQCYHAKRYQIEPDVSAACYFYAMPMLLKGSMLVKNVYFSSLQGDIRFLHLLRDLGGSLQELPEGIELSFSMDHFPGIDIDMGSFSDQTMTLSVLAPFASSPTRIRNVAHIRMQESNRIRAVITELTRLGIRCDELPDGLLIYPGPYKGGDVETYDDHRIAMSFSLIGLKQPGIRIKNPSCCKKTFEGYFEALEAIQKSV